MPMLYSEELYKRLQIMTSEDKERYCRLFLWTIEKFIDKHESCRIVGCSHATFERIVRKSFIPNGTKYKGDTKHYWRISDILSLLMKRYEGLNIV